MNRLLAIVLLTAVALAACDSRPEVQNVEVTRIVELPVTVISEVEVTRFVQLTRLVDVIIEVTRAKEVEVTRIVDKVITATPRPSETPSETPTPTTPAQSGPVTVDQESEPTPAGPLGSQLLASMINTRNNIQSYGFQIDNGVSNGYLICSPVIELHDRVAASPAYDIAGSGPTEQNAYHNYQDALTTFIQGVDPLTLYCRDFILKPVPRKARGGIIAACIGPHTALNCLDFIPEYQWSSARAKVNEADDILSVAITNLDKEFDVPGG